jgi:Kef-type K+ transport system membrane component KefB
MSMMTILTVSAFSLLKLSIFITFLVIAYRVIKRVSKKENYLENKLNNLLSILKGKESLYALFFVFVLVFSTITESLGFHFIIGAFFASMLISESLVGKKHLESFHKNTSLDFLDPHLSL